MLYIILKQIIRCIKHTLDMSHAVIRSFVATKSKEYTVTICESFSAIVAFPHPKSAITKSLRFNDFIH